MTKQYRISLTFAEMDAINGLIATEAEKATDRAFDSANQADMERALWWRDLRRRFDMRTRSADDQE